eukprot:scaffold6570_cov108-Skeletonema_dohrnii-CCMP3373.AAC.2
MIYLAASWIGPPPHIRLHDTQRAENVIAWGILNVVSTARYNFLTSVTLQLFNAITCASTPAVIMMNTIGVRPPGPLCRSVLAY